MTRINRVKSLFTALVYFIASNPAPDGRSGRRRRPDTRRTFEYGRVHLSKRRSTEEDQDAVSVRPSLERQLGLARARSRSLQLRLRAVADNLGHGLSLYDRHARLVVCNQQFLEIYRLPPELRKDAAPASAASSRPGLPAIPMSATTAEAYVTDRIGAVREHRPLGGIHRLNSGQVISMTHQPMADGGWVSTHRDVTELFNMQAELTHLAYHDPLTGLPNRTLFYQRIGRRLRQRRRYERLCRALPRSRRLQADQRHARPRHRRCAAAASSPPASPGRSAPATPQRAWAATSSPSSMSAATRRARSISPTSSPSSASSPSISMARWSASPSASASRIAPADGTDTDALLHSADLALYSAKRGGRGGIRAYAPSLDRAAIRPPPARGRSAPRHRERRVRAPLPAHPRPQGAAASPASRH